MRGPGPSRVVHEQGAFAPTGGHAAFPVGWRNGVDWSAHIPKLVDVWAGRLLGAPGYHGNPVGTHQPVLHRFPFGTAELARGLERWEETVDELFIGEIGEARQGACPAHRWRHRHVGPPRHKPPRAGVMRRARGGNTPDR